MRELQRDGRTLQCEFKEIRGIRKCNIRGDGGICE